ncbi:MAG: phosphatase PAP2 family protein [Candidatus Marinimicrobia bacterium]|nr:phosphatase PAP2 family protein [Candidatus Neomarinimicrobiota bacterium]
MKCIFVFLISFSFTLSESYLTKADVFLTSTLEGNNNNPFMDVAMEGLALATPFIEFGTAGLNQIANDKLIPSFAASLGVQFPIALGKYIFKRERPQRHYKPRMWNSRFTPSFPSGHAATTAAWATAVTLQNPELLPFMVSYTFLSGYSQVYVGNHYVSDIVAGWVLGWATAKLFYNTIESSQNKSMNTSLFKISIPLK